MIVSPAIVYGDYLYFDIKLTGPKLVLFPYSNSNQAEGQLRMTSKRQLWPKLKAQLDTSTLRTK